MKCFEYDCAIITAYNSNYTSKENLQRTKQLEAKIQISKYGVKKFELKNVDNFFVVDIKNKGKLEEDLIRWSNEYEQTNIRFIPKGNVVNDKVISYIDLNNVTNYYEVANILGKWSMTLIANRDWKDINV